MSVVKAALIQMELKADPKTDSFDKIRDCMIDAHMPLIEKAADQGVQVIGLQEVWTMPYFPAEIDSRWFGTAEPIPDGPTTQLMMETAKRLNMVIVSPIYESGNDGKLYYCSCYRCRWPLSRKISKDTHTKNLGIRRKILFYFWKYRFSSL